MQPENPSAAAATLVVTMAAGGLEASRTILRTLPRDFPAAIVVLQQPSTLNHRGAR